MWPVGIVRMNRPVSMRHNAMSDWLFTSRVAMTLPSGLTAAGSGPLNARPGNRFPIGCSGSAAHTWIVLSPLLMMRVPSPL